ncbi:MAG: hypothetical protein HRU06_10270 [Oceanospirillaceae bacterium]|nr:hypothetical protein [Oceanospirillaceae bacterium]
MSSNSNKLTLWLILLVAVVPVIAAFFMYYSGLLAPSDQVNEGELIQSQTLEQWQLKNGNSDWQQTAQWQILHTQPLPCDSQTCSSWSEALPQVIKLLGKDSGRVVLFQVGNEAEMLQTSMLSKLGEAVWIADPLGNVVMRYSPDLSPKQLLKDLKKLLKISGIG